MPLRATLGSRFSADGQVECDAKRELFGNATGLYIGPHLKGKLAFFNTVWSAAGVFAAVSRSRMKSGRGEPISAQKTPLWWEKTRAGVR